MLWACQPDTIGQLTCTDPNCTRAHALDRHHAELYAFHWRLTDLGVGYALDGSLLHMSHNRAKRILADMPYLDEDFYHQFRWHKPIPAPRPYGDMIVTATSRRANLNEQPRKRDTTPHRATTPRRSSSRLRYGSPRPSPRQPPENLPWVPPTKAPPVPRTVLQHGRLTIPPHTRPLSG